MRHAPSCPLHLGLLDSPDYWTDNALVATVRPLSADEWHRLAIGSQTQQQRQRRNGDNGVLEHGRWRSRLILIDYFLL